MGGAFQKAQGKASLLGLTSAVQPGGQELSVSILLAL